MNARSLLLPVAVALFAATGHAATLQEVSGQVGDAQGVRPVAWYDSDAPPRSGWAWGQEHVKNGLAAIEANVGEGKLYIFAPEVLYRSQPHGTFKFVFNGIFLSTTKAEG